jgi:hypothetical protein
MLFFHNLMSELSLTPLLPDVRRLTSVAAFARTLGFAALWDKYDAPDARSRNAAGDYICS